MDNTTVVPDDSMVHYGATITSLLTPTEPKGDYDFFIRGNQAAQLFLNPAGSSPAEAEGYCQRQRSFRTFLSQRLADTQALSIW